MMQLTIERTSQVERTPRFVQTRDKFSIDSDGTSTATWDVDVTLPASWSVGLIVGESGAGKTTLARRLMDAAGGGILVTPRDADGNLIEPFDWPADRCVVDGFPEGMGINDITLLMSSVGFSSPPAWLRPFHTLSIGEQFRATVARTLAESLTTIIKGQSVGPSELLRPGSPTQPHPVAVIDEFANAVDVKAAQIGSAAVAKCVRRMNLRLIAVTTREDVAEHLEPDWIIPMRKGEPVRLARGCLRRPDIKLEIHRTSAQAWAIFRHHHYLDHDVHKAARHYVGRVGGGPDGGEPACYTAVTHWPTTKGLVHREHRTVCLPTFQGVGLGNRMSDTIASAYAAIGKYFSTTSHPALMRSRAASPLWHMIRRPSIRSTSQGAVECGSTDRVTASFEFVGPPNPDAARRFGLLR